MIILTEIQRIIQRDQIPLNQIKERVRNQWPEERRTSLADFEITNDGNTLLLPQIMRIHQTLIQKGIDLENLNAAD